MKVLVVDNYDSFTYNLVQSIAAIVQVPVTQETIRIYRNDSVTMGDVEAFAPNKIIISPGPGGPDEGGISEEVIRNFLGRSPILGVCLGLQIIAHMYGASIVRATKPVHGKRSSISHTGTGLFYNIPNPTVMCRYHSLCVSPNTVPKALQVTAHSDDGTIMALEHSTLPLYGVQFHPESFLSPDGNTLLRNFLEAA